MPVLILRTFGFLTLSSLKKSLFSISSASGSRGRGGPGAVLCHFVFSKLLKYILLSADVTVAGRSEQLFCHHLCLFERCCITYFLHWPTATLTPHQHGYISTVTLCCQALLLCVCSWQLVQSLTVTWLQPTDGDSLWLMLLFGEWEERTRRTHAYTQTCNVCLTSA